MLLKVSGFILRCCCWTFRIFSKRGSFFSWSPRGFCRPIDQSAGARSERARESGSLVVAGNRDGPFLPSILHGWDDNSTTSVTSPQPMHQTFSLADAIVSSAVWFLHGESRSLVRTAVDRHSGLHLKCNVYDFYQRFMMFVWPLNSTMAKTRSTWSTERSKKDLSFRVICTSFRQTSFSYLPTSRQRFPYQRSRFSLILLDFS